MIKRERERVREYGTTRASGNKDALIKNVNMIMTPPPLNPHP